MKENEKAKKLLNEKEKACDFSLYRISRFLQPSILLFLLEGPSYGYELIEKLNKLGFHSEAVDIGGVYRTLRKLERTGCVKSLWQKDGNRKKRMYRITSLGKSALKLWIGRIKERQKVLSRFVRMYERKIK